jgi:hypothetical protein
MTLSGGYGNANSEGDLDGMVPLFGSAQGDVYTDVEGQIGADKSWFGSMGVGGRQALNDNLLLGAYGFIDRTQTISSFGNNNNKWVVFNPGIEAMTPTWDARINGYFPVGPNERVVSGDFFGDQVGISKYVTFQGHNQFDGLYDEVQGIGTGTDADVGYTFKPFRNLRVHGGGYYFSMPNTTNIKGVETGVEMPVNDYTSIAVDDTYDNVEKNTAMISLKLTLGNIHKTQTGPVTERLLDPIHRHLGTLYTSSSIPSASKFTFSGRKGILERDNIWFFTGNGGNNFDSSLGTQNCTAEHPCNGSSFTQSNMNIINGITPNTNFYFNPGNYSLGSSTNISGDGAEFQLNNGQSMYGRTIDYKLPASSPNYPIFYGSISPQGNNTLDSFEMLNNNNPTFPAITINNANYITMNNLFIGQLAPNVGYSIPISIQSSQNILLENSTINAFATQRASIVFVYGISNNGGVVTISKNVFNIKANGQRNSTAIGIQNVGGQITANNNTFNVEANLRAGNSSAYGTENNSGTMELNNNTFNVLANGGRTHVYGIQGSNITGNNNVFNLTALNISDIISGADLLSGNNNMFTCNGVTC